MVLSRQSVKGLPLCFNSFRELFHFSLVLFPFPLKTMCWEYLSFFSLATPCGIWDLSSLTRDWTHTFWIRRQSFNHFLKVFNYIIVLESFFTSFSWILKLRGIFLQSHIVRFSWQSSKALFLFVGSQKSSLKHGSLLSCPTFLHDLQWWILFFFFCKKWYPTTQCMASPSQMNLQMLISKFSLTSTAETDHEGDGCLMEPWAERFVQCSPFATSKR